MSTRSPRPLLLPALGLALLLSPVPAAQDASFTEFPGLNFYGVSGDGAWIVGNDGWEAMRWTAGGGPVVLPGGKQAFAVSDSGLLVAGELELTPTTREPARFAPLVGWQPLGGIPGATPAAEPHARVTGMSANGNVIVGLQQVGSPGGDVDAAWRWTNGVGTEALGVPATALESVALCVSADGQVVGGTIDDPLTGSSYRSVVLWDANGDWEEIVPLPPGAVYQAGIGALDATGDRAVGRYWDGNAYLWERDVGVTLLPPPPGIAPGQTVDPTVISRDGTVIAGENLGNVAGAPNDSWIWTAATGTRLIRDVIAQIGGDFTDGLYPLRYVRGVSADGTRLVGGSLVALGDGRAWTLDLPPGGIGAWVDRGAQLQAGGVTLELQGEGLLTADSPTTLLIDGVVPFTTAWLVVGLSELSAPFKGGTMVPHPDLVFPFGLVFPGQVPLGFDWPAGVPSGFPIFFQVWGQSSPLLGQFVASNALEAVAP